MSEFAGRVALVTGGSRGIGRAVSMALADLGARVVISSRSSREAGERLAAELPGSRYVGADVTDVTSVATLMHAIASDHGRLDIVVNNAGTATAEPVPHHELAAVTAEDWNRLLSTNVVGPWNVISAAMPLLAESDNAVVVNVSSLAGSRIGGSSIPYAVSKAALDHLTRLLAVALAPTVRVNAVAPGVTETPRTEAWETAKSKYRAAAPLRRIAEPADVAAACVSLARLRHVTGEVLFVDGGRHLR